MTIPGIGSKGATALLAAVGEDASLLHNGRGLATWIGLVPRQHSTAAHRPFDGMARRRVGCALHIPYAGSGSKPLRHFGDTLAAYGYRGLHAFASLSSARSDCPASACRSNGHRPRRCSAPRTPLSENALAAGRLYCWAARSLTPPGPYTVSGERPVLTTPTASISTKLRRHSPDSDLRPTDHASFQANSRRPRTTCMAARQTSSNGPMHPRTSPKGRVDVSAAAGAPPGSSRTRRQHPPLGMWRTGEFLTSRRRADSPGPHAKLRQFSKRYPSRSPPGGDSMVTETRRLGRFKSRPLFLWSR